MLRDWTFYLEDILESSGKVLTYTQGMTVDAFRDVIAHHYFGLNVNVVWDVVQNKIPEIVQSAGTLLTSVQDKNN